MIPPKLLEEWCEKCIEYLDDDAGVNEYGMPKLVKDAPQKTKEAYQRMIEWHKKGIK